MVFIEFTSVRSEKILINVTAIVCVSACKQGSYVRIEDGDGFVCVDSYQSIVDKLKSLKLV